MIIALRDLDQGHPDAVNISYEALYNMFDTRIMDIDKMTQEALKELIEYFATGQLVDVNIMDYNGDYDELEKELKEMAEFYKLNIEIV